MPSFLARLGARAATRPSGLKSGKTRASASDEEKEGAGEAEIEGKRGEVAEGRGACATGSFPWLRSFVSRSNRRTFDPVRLSFETARCSVPHRFLPFCRPREGKRIVEPHLGVTRL